MSGTTSTTTMTPNNPFTLAHFKSYKETREVNGQKTIYGMATGRLKDIRKFLGTEIKLQHAEVVYASSLVNVDTLVAMKNVDNHDDNDENEDEEMGFLSNIGGNLKFDYLGSNQEFASLFQKVQVGVGLLKTQNVIPVFCGFGGGSSIST